MSGVEKKNRLNKGGKIESNWNEEPGDKYKNPFTVPVDHDIFALRDKEKMKKKKEREAQQLQKVGFL